MRAPEMSAADISQPGANATQRVPLLCARAPWLAASITHKPMSAAQNTRFLLHIIPPHMRPAAGAAYWIVNFTSTTGSYRILNVEDAL